MTTYSGCICDVCGRSCASVERFTAPRKSVGEPRAGSRTPHEWDVGKCCLNTRFRPMDHRQIDVTVTVRA